MIFPKTSKIPKISKKGQGISITTIVIAVLALIVLVVLVLIFTGQIGKFGKGTQQLQAGTVCQADAARPDDGITTLNGQWSFGACPSGKTEQKPTQVTDVAAHAGMKCCA